MGDATRATFLMALSQGHSLPANELARRAHVTPSTASIQLAKLVEGGLLTVKRNGRHRYYGLSDPNVATAIESLAVIAPRRPASSLKQARVGSELQAARTCYDHLAGALGVALLDALQRQRLLTAALEPTKLGGIERLPSSRAVRPTEKGHRALIREFALDLERPARHV